MKKNSFLVVAIAILFFAMVLGSLSSNRASAAPQAAPTPISVTERNGASPALLTFFDAQAIAADTTSTCFEITFWDIADLYYSIDQGTTNTTTLTLRWGNNSSALVNGVNVVASNAADASDLQQFQTFGRFACILADVATTDTVTITVNALVK